MYRKYYSINDMPQLPKNNEKHTETLTKKSEEIHTEKRKKTQALETDDIILLAIVFLLLADDCSDKLLILAIGVVFLSGM